MVLAANKQTMATSSSTINNLPATFGCGRINYKGEYRVSMAVSVVMLQDSPGHYCRIVVCWRRKPFMVEGDEEEKKKKR